MQRHRKQVPRLRAAAYVQGGSGKGGDKVQNCFLEQGSDKRWLVVLKFQMNSTVGYKTLCHNFA